MLARWCNEINSINLCIHQLKRIARKTEFLKGGRGRKPKRAIEKYAFSLVLKEFDKRTLRGAEEHLTRLVFNERVDHSVLSYWENNLKMIRLLQAFVSVAGAMLDKTLSSLFSFVDATKFTNWKIEGTFVTVCNRIAKETVYPVGVSFKKKQLESLLRNVFRREMDYCMQMLNMMIIKQLEFCLAEDILQLSVQIKTDGEVIGERKQESFTECLNTD